MAMKSALESGVARIGEAGEKGFGAFATARFEDGVTVADYVGEVLDAREIDARFHGKGVQLPNDVAWLLSRKARGVGVTGDYIYSPGDGIFIDAEDPDASNWCRFINHAATDAPECNLRSKSLPFGMDGKPRIWFVSTRVIEPGDELLFDYGDTYW